MTGPDCAAPPLVIRLFGPFEVRLNGAPLPRLRSRRVQWLLALLALRHEAAVERAWLAGTLWPDAPESQAMVSLRGSLTDLRRALGPEAERLRSPSLHALSLDLSGAQVDLVAFDQAIARGDLASLEQAISLYRGPLLEGCAEEWAFQERLAREQAYLGALERLGASAIERGGPATAERYLRLVVAVDPLRESAQRGLMQALAAGGNYTAAAQVYQDLRRLLHQELNAEPDPETQALFQQLRAEARGKAGARGQGSGVRKGTDRHGRALDLVGTDPRPLTPHPSGTVTFLLTDIESSTKLWLHHPDAMRHALARHDALAAAIIQEHDGLLVKQRGEGDSFFAVFARASDAVTAALEFQQALAREAWPAETPLQVRVALHTGEAERREGDYYGLAVNHCARLRAVGHGGQTLLSQTTAALVRDDLPADVGVRELGAHRLKDLQRAESIFQLVHPELPAAFPPLRSLEAFAHNLPVQLTSFIGREREITEVKRLLSPRDEGRGMRDEEKTVASHPSSLIPHPSRLLTLTGAGGCGKTRLALQVAADLVEEYGDGVWLVELAALSDPGLVPQAVALALGVRGEPNRPLTATLADALRVRSLLLVLDNCEHLLPACAQLAETLLQRCANLRLLATSREGLRIAGETTYRVPPLSLPDLKRLPPAAMLTQFEAAQLFVERATAALPSFLLNDENAAAVARVCHRLDGMPLAIELAAAWVKALPAEQINERLDDRFRLLTGGSRTALPRQQTLRATIDWSYDLLSEQERALLRRLSVFAGGWTLAAAEVVCGGDGIEAGEVLDRMAGLMEKSLVVYEERQTEARYRLLETIRQYGAEKLQGSREEAALRSQHRDYFLGLAEAAEPELQGQGVGEWLARPEAEHENLRAALAWCTEQGDAEAGLRLGGALWRFWMVRGYLTEGRERLTQLLSLPGAEARTVVRGRVLHGAGVLTFRLGDYEAARALLEEGVALGRELDDDWGIAWSLNNLGNVANLQGEYEAAQALYEEGLVIFRELGDQEGIAWSLYNLGTAVMSQGDYEAARALLEQSLTLCRELGNQRGIALSLGALGTVAGGQGDHEAERALLEKSLALHRELGDQQGIVWSLYSLGNTIIRQGEYETARVLLEEGLGLSRELGSHRDTTLSLGALGHVARETGDYARCAAYYRESLRLRQSRDDRGSIAQALEDFAGLAGRQRQWERAVRLLGAAQGVAQILGRSLPVAMPEEYQRTVDGARAALGEVAFAAAWAAGQVMTLEEAIRCALEEADDA